MVVSELLVASVDQQHQLACKYKRRAAERGTIRAAAYPSNNIHTIVKKTPDSLSPRLSRSINSITTCHTPRIKNRPVVPSRFALLNALPREIL